MPQKTLDFLVTAVDNFGDTGFALDLAESVLSERPEWDVRFFSDDRALFDRLTDGRPHPRVSYFDLSGYENAAPSESVVSFFDRKLPEAHFAKFPHPKKILQLSYLRFDPDVGSMNGTRYRLGNDEIVHLVPSPSECGAGVVVGRRTDVETDGSISGDGTPHLEPDTLLSSAFCYPTTFSKLRLIREAESKIRFAEFGNADAEIPLPYVRFDEYAELVGKFGANVVRGENSAIKAMLAGKPFLWDFYKESNGAHVEKIADFLDFVRPFFKESAAFERYASAIRAVNAEVFGPSEARECADVLLSDTAPFEGMASAIERRDLAATVTEEIER